MGGDLKKAPAGKKATFLVAVLKDPIGANLDRVQIIKGWMDAKGALHEKVYDVAWSGDRKPGADGKLPAVGNTVNVAKASYVNSIGASELLTAWTDPDFDPAQKAFYYARVLEIPTPRWTAYDAPATACRSRRATRASTRNAPTPRRSGTRPEGTRGSSAAIAAIAIRAYTKWTRYRRAPELMRAHRSAAPP